MWSALSLSLSQINKPKSKFIKRRLKKTKKNENENSSDVLYFPRFLATKSPRSFSSPRLLSLPELCPSGNQLFYCAHRFVVSLMSLLLFCFPVKECYCDGRLTKNSFFQLFFTKTSTFFLLRVSRQPQNASLARVLSFSPFQTLCLLLSINDRLLDEFIIASFFLEERKVYFFKNYVNWLQILLQNISSVNSLQKHYKNGKL